MPFLLKLGDVPFLKITFTAMSFWDILEYMIRGRKIGRIKIYILLLEDKSWGG